MSTGFYTHERTFWHAVGLHALFFAVQGWVQPPNSGAGADTPDSKRRFLSLVEASGLMDKLQRSTGTQVTKEDLLRVHTEKYLTEFKKVSDAGGGEVGIYAPFSAGGYDIACISAGLAKGLVNDIISPDSKIKNGYALCRPAGHHCVPHQAMGFCLLANIPIAIEAAKAAHGLGRVAVVDWDVHHGNGTQEIYYERDDVLTISLHQDRCFPPGYSGGEDTGTGKGAGYNINIPLPMGGGNEAYLYAWDKIVSPALEKFKPELIVIASGLDANAVDPLARMLVTTHGYRDLTKRAMAAADKLCGGRLAMVHEGGYSEAYVPFCGQAIVEALAGQAPIVPDAEEDIFLNQQPGPQDTAHHKHRIDEIAKAVVLLK